MSGAAALSVVLLALPDPRLVQHLAAWEKSAKDVTSVRATFTLTRTNPVYKVKEVTFTGAFLHLRPHFTRLRLEPEGDRADFEAYIQDGKCVYAYSGTAKTITEIPVAGRALAGRPPANLPPDAPEWVRRFLARLSVVAVLPESNVALAVLTGPPTGELKNRCHMSFVKNDANYVYLDFRPRAVADLAVFTRARVALYGPNVAKPRVPYTPAVVQVTRPNNETETWTFTDVAYNLPEVGPDLFKFENVPGYTFRKAPPVADKKP